MRTADILRKFSSGRKRGSWQLEQLISEILPQLEQLISEILPQHEQLTSEILPQLEQLISEILPQLEQLISEILAQHEQLMTVVKTSLLAQEIPQSAGHDYWLPLQPRQGSVEGLQA